MPDDLVVDERLVIAGDELAVSFARSSGPGGQHVNKVNTKVLLRWSPRTSRSLPEAVQARFVERYRRRLTGTGEILLTCQQHRHQAQNLRECRRKLGELIRAVARPPKRRRRTKPSRAVAERRLRGKRLQSEKKSRRSFQPE